MAELTRKERLLQIKAARPVSNKSDADVWFYSGPIEGVQYRLLHEWCCNNPRRKNAFFMLLTYGGDPHVAYRMGRCLQDHYDSVTICVNGPCVSAGTLLALAANEIVMTDVGTLGPLDIQLAKQDELFENTSGLTARQAIATMTSHASSTFDELLLALKVNNGGRITLRTAMESAAQLTARMYEPILRQIDPLRLADDQRSISMVREYGARLAAHGGNLQPGALEQLVIGYTSHLFEIDRKEAEDRLFRRVRCPSEAERELLAVVWKRWTEPSLKPELLCPSDRRPTTTEDHHDQTTHHRTDPAGSNPQDHEAAQDWVQTDGEGGATSLTDSDPGSDETVQ